MPVKVADYTTLARRPSWDVDGGRWYVSQTVPRDGSPRKMYRHKPSINLICESLLGSSVRDKNGRICGVAYPTLSRRCEIYREGIEIVTVFQDYRDLFSLAVYRRYVTQCGGIPMDMLFFNLAMKGDFSREDWEILALRMPEYADIRAACLRRAYIGTERFKAAAE